jgi:hypothetical protein
VAFTISILQLKMTIASAATVINTITIELTTLMIINDAIRVTFQILASLRHLRLSLIVTNDCH